jgi:hypothetical protein
MGSELSEVTQPPRSNDELLAAYAHARLSQERDKLLREAAACKAKHPRQAELVMVRANAFRIAMRFFTKLQRESKSAASE